MSKLIDQIDKAQLREHPTLEVGSTIKVYYKIKEGEKERIQPFEGVLIAKKGGPKNARASFTVRKVSSGFGIERVFPLHSPKVEKIEVLRRGNVRRSKLYYLRDLAGKAARISEKMVPR